MAHDIIVGSVPMANAEAVFSAVGGALGARTECGFGRRKPETIPNCCVSTRKRQSSIERNRAGETAMSQQNTDRIQITHIGSLPRPHDLLDQIKAKYTGQSYDEQRFDSALPGRSRTRSASKRLAASITSPMASSRSPASSPISRRGSTASSRAISASRCSRRKSPLFPNITKSISRPRCSAAPPCPWCRWSVSARSIQGRSVAAHRYRQCESRRRDGRRAARPCLPAGDRAIGRRPQRILQVRRGISSTRSPPSSARNTAPSPKRASSFRSTIPSCPTSSSTRISTRSR